MRQLLTALAVVLLAACGSPASAPDSRTLPLGAVALEVDALPDSVVRLFHANVTDRRRLVIRDAAEWAQFWNEATSNVQPRPAVPAVDFTTGMLVVATMGTRPSGGYAIAVERAYEDAGGRVHAEVLEVSPGAGCVTTAALTAPVAVVRVPRRPGAVEFVERTRVRECD